MLWRGLEPADANLVADLDGAARGSSAWSASAWRDYLVPETSIGVFSGPVLVGFAVFSRVVDEAELLFVTVGSAWRKAGLGRALLERSFPRLSAVGVTQVFLEVSEANSPARKLYSSLGFEEIGRRNGYYADGSTARILRLRIARTTDDLR